MVKIKMLATKLGSPDGRTVHTYARGEQYELPDDLAKVFVDEGWGKQVQAKARKQGDAKKDKGAAPENKQR
jgi:hypothetical protein